jgi:histidinol dehydrogenase
VLVTWSARFARQVGRIVDALAKDRAVVRRSISAHGVAIVTRSGADAMSLANRLAPEHLVVERESLISGPTTAGAVFIGPYTAQAAGDYATGSNHVLPTAGAARFRGGLSAADFVRVMSVQRVTRNGLKRLAPTILALSRAEGLASHAESIEIRLS